MTKEEASLLVAQLSRLTRPFFSLGVVIANAGRFLRADELPHFTGEAEVHVRALVDLLKRHLNPEFTADPERGGHLFAYSLVAEDRCDDEFRFLLSVELGSIEEDMRRLDAIKAGTIPVDVDDKYLPRECQPGVMELFGDEASRDS